MILKGTLILTEQQPPAPERTEQFPAFNPDKLPKLPKRVALKNFVSRCVTSRAS